MYNKTPKWVKEASVKKIIALSFFPLIKLFIAIKKKTNVVKSTTIKRKEGDIKVKSWLKKKKGLIAASASSSWERVKIEKEKGREWEIRGLKKILNGKEKGLKT